MRHIVLFFGIFGAFLLAADSFAWQPFHAGQVLTAAQLNDALGHTIEWALSCCISFACVIYFEITKGARLG